jgi:carbamate kinase
VDNGNIVIAGGGGGIPTMLVDGTLTPVDAVIDKDFTSMKMAELVNADVLMILTAVPNVIKGYGTDNEETLTNHSIEEMEALIASGEFPAGSMGPKVEAAVAFVKSGPDRATVITSLENAKDAMANGAGT